MAVQDRQQRIEKLTATTFLLDFYAELLTPKQANALRLFYEEDLSLSEIAEHFGSSRQAVHELVKKGEELLAFYEQKLALGAAYRQREQIITRLQELAGRLTDADQAAELAALASALEEDS